MSTTMIPEAEQLAPGALGSSQPARQAHVPLLGWCAMLVTALAATGCATTLMPERERLHSELLWKNESRELATSVWVSPFFRDGSRRLLTLDPPNEVELLVTPDGQPILPGEAIEVLPAGTRVTVLSVGFPTRWASVARPLMTPRDQPWLELAVAGRSSQTPYVVVLPPEMKTQEEVSRVIGKWLAPVGVDDEVRALPAQDRTVIATKQLETGVSRRALELAFGSPNLRRVYGEGESVMEEWTWVSDLKQRRTAWLRDGVVERVEVQTPGTVSR